MNCSWQICGMTIMTCIVKLGRMYYDAKMDACFVFHMAYGGPRGNSNLTSSSNLGKVPY